MSAPVQIPDPLVPWTEWVTAGDLTLQCPTRLDAPDTAVCAWPGPLTLRLTHGGGQFSQEWEIFAETGIPLPGDSKRMPAQVTLDGKPAAVLMENQRPVVRAKAGLHRVAGSFLWFRLPETLSVPDETAQISLSVNHTPHPRPFRDPEGRLWIKKQEKQTDPATARRTEIALFRKITDGHPVEVTTRVLVSVSGDRRQEILPIPALHDARPVAVRSPLSLRLAPDGSLMADLRPGEWELELTHLLSGSPHTLRTSPRTQTETWVFLPRPALRMAELTGVPPVDPSQTRLPEEWKSHAAYRVSPEATPSLTIRRKAGAKTAQRIRMERDIWVDFDAGGATIQDHLTGTLSHRQYLGMDQNGPLLPGRIVRAGTDRLITGQNGRQGIEVPAGPLNMTAVSRFQHPVSGASLPTGWRLPLDSARIHLHLPPGYHLSHISGAEAPDHATWLTRWTLLDLFVLVLLMAAATRLWGWIWGGVMGMGIALFHHSFPIPAPFWFLLLITTALGRLLAEGDRKLRFPIRHQILSGVHLLLLAVAVVSAMVYGVSQIRTAIYPQLEKPQGAFAPPTFRSVATDVAEMTREASDPILQKTSREHSPVPAAGHRMQKEPVITQTGPGLPDWQWNRIPMEMGFSADSRNLVLRLIPPWAAASAALLRVLFLAVVLLRFAAGFPFAGIGNIAALLPLFLVCTSPLSVKAEDSFPPPPLLQELRERLTEKAPCEPRCGRVGMVRLAISSPDVAPPKLTMEMELHAGRMLAFPIPRPDHSWMRDGVFLDAGIPMKILSSQNQDLIPLSEGVYHLRMEGTLLTDAVRFDFPLPPSYVHVTAPGWIIDGLDGDHQVRGSLRFRPVRTKPEPQAETPPASPDLIPYARIHKTISIDREWRMTTRVHRPYPGTRTVPLTLPLLPGETVLTEGPVVTRNSIRIELPADGRTVHWQSTLPMDRPITLSASQTADTSETWQVHASTDWHLSTKGPLPGPGETWHPAPGETLTVTATPMPAAPGQTITIDQVNLTFHAGRDRRRLTLDARIRTGKALTHPITGPEHARAEELRIDGRPQPLPDKGATVPIALSPGEHRVSLVWELPPPDGIRWLPETIRMPFVDLGVDAANIHQEIRMDRKSWLLFTDGPALGPAVLAWSWLFVILIGAALAALFIPQAPLGITGWILLGLGLVPLSPVEVLFVAGWFAAVGWRRQSLRPDWPGYNTVQVLLSVLTILALYSLYVAVRTGLLGAPEMQVAGNGSTQTLLHWTQDISGGILPRPNAFVAPLLWWRILMFAWAIWLASRLLLWSRWALESFRMGPVWIVKKNKKTPADPVLDLDIKD